MLVETAIVWVGFLAWIYLILLHGRYWRLAERLPDHVDSPETWPSVAAVIPARNEADVIAETVRRHEAQDYPGDYRVIIVDDGSGDGTGDVARAAAGDRTQVIEAEERPAGWMGKVWAMEQGLRRLKAAGPLPGFILFTDADVHHPADSLRRLVAKAEAEDRDLVSLMVKLKAETFWERLLIPAFVLFFAKLYPFSRVNDPRNRTAAAAGGCMLVRGPLVEKAGLTASIRDQLIDDCALARQVRDAGDGRLWLGLTEDVESARGYGGLGGVWKMVARSAFTQLRFSALLLIGSVIGMALLYLAPPVLAVHLTLQAGATGDIGDLLHGCLALVTTALMMGSYRDAAILYRQPFWMGYLLPLAATLYVGMTVDSAIRHWRGRGGGWKGRYQAKDAG